MLKEELSRTDMLMYSIKTEMDTTFQLITLCHRELSETLLLLTLIFLNSQSQDMNLDMPKQILTPCLSGKHNSVTFLTEPKLSLINSFPPEKLNGTLKMVLLCFCHMVTMVKDQNTLLPEWKDSFNFVIKMTIFHLMELTITTKISYVK